MVPPKKPANKNDKPCSCHCTISIFCVKSCAHTCSSQGEFLAAQTSQKEKCPRNTIRNICKISPTVTHFLLPITLHGAKTLLIIKLRIPTKSSVGNSTASLQGILFQQGEGQTQFIGLNMGLDSNPGASTGNLYGFSHVA